MVRMALAADDTDLLHKGWRLVEKNQGRIDELILDMLSFAKEREAGREPTDLGAVAADVVETVRGRATDSGVSLTLDVDPQLGPVPADPDGLHRAILNVVSNAVDAATGSENAAVAVSVGVSEDGAIAEVTVADTGPGVPADKREAIFEPFVSTKGARGTGLGLSVSRKTLREHGGDVVVEDGPGGRFVLRLPR
jgi:signal transduction histidine kinase